MFLFALAFLPLTAWCGDAELPISVGPARLESHVQSMRAIRDAGVVRQRFDYSCGSAALATL